MTLALIGICIMLLFIADALAGIKKEIRLTRLNSGSMGGKFYEMRNGEFWAYDPVVNSWERRADIPRKS